MIIIDIVLMMTPIINIILKMTMAVLVIKKKRIMLLTHHGALGLMEVDVALVRLVTGDAVIWANLVIIKLKQHADIYERYYI